MEHRMNTAYYKLVTHACLKQILD